MKTFANAWDGESASPRRASPGHAVKFYETDAQLVASVRSFVGRALRAGDGVVIVATAAHQSAVLSASGAFAHGGPIVVLSAQETLDELMPRGVLDRSAFRQVIDMALARASRSATGKVRAFGEMVDLLARDGRIEEALGLEEMWNQAIAEKGVSLLCGYALSSFPRASDADAFRAVCESHAHVEPASCDEQMRDDVSRRVARLEQESRGLKREIEARATLASRLVERERALAASQDEAATSLEVSRLAEELDALLATILRGADSLLDANAAGDAEQAAREIRRAAQFAGALTRRLQRLDGGRRGTPPEGN